MFLCFRCFCLQIVVSTPLAIEQWGPRHASFSCRRQPFDNFISVKFYFFLNCKYDCFMCFSLFVCCCKYDCFSLFFCKYDCFSLFFYKYNRFFLFFSIAFLSFYDFPSVVWSSKDNCLSVFFFSLYLKTLFWSVFCCSLERTTLFSSVFFMFPQRNNTFGVWGNNTFFGVFFVVPSREQHYFRVFFCCSFKGTIVLEFLVPSRKQHFFWSIFCCSLNGTTLFFSVFCCFL